MKGKRAKLKVPDFKIGDRVLGEYGSKVRAGEITALGNGKARVHFDTGHTGEVLLSKLSYAPRDEEDDPENEEGLSGFNQYTIKWSADTTHFNFDVEGVHFYGWFRKATNRHDKEVCWAVDLFAKTETFTYAVRSIGYVTGDPRKNLRSLNADLCAAANDWFWQRCKGSIETLDDLQKRLQRPQIEITNLATIDKILLRLRETRDTAIRFAGRRYCRIKGDNEKDPELGIQIDLSKQSFLLKGKVPPLSVSSVETSAIMDDAGKAAVGGSGKKKEVTRERVAYTPSSQNVKDLVALLQKTKDKSEARKIRAMLRKMGHTGGARAMKEE